MFPRLHVINQFIALVLVLPAVHTHMSAILSIGEAMNAAVLLQLHHLFNRSLFNWNERLGALRSISNCISMLDQLLWSQERANVLSSEGWVSWRR